MEFPIKGNYQNVETAKIRYIWGFILLKIPK